MVVLSLFTLLVLLAMQGLLAGYCWFGGTRMRQLTFLFLGPGENNRTSNSMQGYLSQRWANVWVRLSSDWLASLNYFFYFMRCLKLKLDNIYSLHVDNPYGSDF